MRVLCIVSVAPTQFSGATKSWERLIPLLRKEGIEIETFFGSYDGPLMLEHSDGTRVAVKWIRGPARGSYAGLILTTVALLWRQRRRFDCVFFLGAPDSLFATLLVKRLLGARIVYRMTMLGEDDPLAISHVGRFGWLRALILRRIDAAICINPAMADCCREAGLLPEQVVTILQGTDVSRFSPPSKDGKAVVRAREGLPTDAQVVLFCGAIVERKGVDLLLNAWSSIRSDHPNAHLLLVGPNGGQIDDPGDRFLTRMKQHSASSGFDDSVRFLGYRDDVDDLMKASDIFVLPSRMEGSPNVLVEAMATGLAVVISRLPGVEDAFVRDEVEALIVPQEDVPSLASAISRYLADPEAASQFGGRARARVVENFSSVGVARLYAKTLRGSNEFEGMQ